MWVGREPVSTETATTTMPVVAHVASHVCIQHTATRAYAISAQQGSHTSSAPPSAATWAQVPSRTPVHLTPFPSARWVARMRGPPRRHPRCSHRAPTAQGGRRPTSPRSTGCRRAMPPAPARSRSAPYCTGSCGGSIHTRCLVCRRVSALFRFVPAWEAGMQVQACMRRFVTD